MPNPTKLVWCVTLTLGTAMHVSAQGVTANSARGAQSAPIAPRTRPADTTTKIEIYGFEPIHPVAGTSFLAGEPDPWAPWVLLARNLLLVGVFGFLVAELRALSSPRAAPVRAVPAAAPGSYFDPTAAR